MFRSITIFLFVTSFEIGHNSVFGYECDIDEVDVCYTDLVSYEGLLFPFYGADEKELDETCVSMNSTFQCVADFVHHCKDDENCDKVCQKTVAIFMHVYQNTGVRPLYDHLCNPEDPFRKSYLEHYQCLEKAEDKYCICQNKSHESQEFMASYDFEENNEMIIDAHCCYFSWYEACYTNATMETCGANATFVISFALHNLMGSDVNKKCVSRSQCHEPPLRESYVAPKLPKKYKDEDSKTDGSRSTMLHMNGFLLIFSVIIILANKHNH